MRRHVSGMVGYLRQAHQFAKTPAGGRTGHQHRQRLNVRPSHCPGTAVHLQAHAEGIGANQAAAGEVL